MIAAILGRSKGLKKDMSSYKYVNGVYVMETHIIEPYRRFHGCNAQHARFTLCNDDRGLLPTVEVYQFISYATRIMQVLHNLKHDTWHIQMVCNPFDYSRTTTRQVRRYIRETFAGVFDVTDIDRGLKECELVTPTISTYAITGSVQCDFMTRKTLDRMWR